MVIVKRRQSDDPDGDEYTQRPIFTRYKGIVSIIMFLIGGGATQFGITYTIPGIHEVEARMTKAETELISVKAEVKANTTALATHINTSKDLSIAQRELIEEKLKSINDKLDDLKKLIQTRQRE